MNEIEDAVLKRRQDPNSQGISPEMIERVLKENANKNCKKCFGIGRTGFSHGNAIPCRCALDNLAAKAKAAREQKEAERQAKRDAARKEKNATGTDADADGGESAESAED